MKAKNVIILSAILVLILLALTVSWLGFPRNNTDGSSQDTAYITLDCTSSFEQNGVNIDSQGCPLDEDNDGYLDTEEYVVEAENTTDSVKYVEHNFREDSRGGGDRVYLLVEPDITRSFSVSFGDVRKYTVDETNILKRDIIVRDELQLGVIKETSTETFLCPDGSEVDWSSKSLTVEKFGWEVRYSCKYSYDPQVGYTFDGAELNGRLDADERRILLYQLTDDNGNTVIYQEESGTGFVYPNQKEFEITLYITE